MNKQKAEIMKKVIAEHYEVDESLMTSDIRKKPYAQARQMLSYLLVCDAGYTYTEAGRYICRDRTTVMYNCGLIKDQIFLKMQEKWTVEEVRTAIEKRTSPILRAATAKQDIVEARKMINAVADMFGSLYGVDRDGLIWWITSKSQVTDSNKDLSDINDYFEYLGIK